MAKKPAKLSKAPDRLKPAKPDAKAKSKAKAKPKADVTAKAEPAAESAPAPKPPPAPAAPPPKANAPLFNPPRHLIDGKRAVTCLGIKTQAQLHGCGLASQAKTALISTAGLAGVFHAF